MKILKLISLEVFVFEIKIQLNLYMYVCTTGIF